MPVATMPAAVDVPAEPALRDDHAAPPELPVRRASGGGDPGPSGHGDGEGDGRRGWPIALAVITIVLLAAALTFAGMIVGGVWANLSGAQLPAA